MDYRAWLIIPHDCTFMKVWTIIDGINCLVTSITYAWLSVTYNHKERKTNYIMDIFLFIDEISFAIFTLSILFGFITDYLPRGEITPVKDIQSIAQNYSNNELITDILTWIPFHWIWGNWFREANLFFLIKTIRLKRAARLLSIQKMT